MNARNPQRACPRRALRSEARTRYVLRLLPGGNAASFPLIDAQLRKRKVLASWHVVGRGRLYRIPVSSVKRLPTDKGEPYLPVTDDSGYSVYGGTLSDYAKMFNIRRWHWHAISHTEAHT